MSAAISALNTVALKGYELDIPDWLFPCIIFAVALSGFFLVVRLFKSFCFVKRLNEQEED